MGMSGEECQLVKMGENKFMAVNIVVPELGESVVEATVGKWHKKVGDRVAAGELLVELQTDKVDLEINAPSAGVLAQILRQEEADVAIGDVLGSLEAEGAVVSNAPAAPAPQAAPVAKPASDGVNATPVAQRVAQVEGVDLAQVQGTGRSGKITKSDVQAVAAPEPIAPAQPVAVAPAPTAIPASVLADLFPTSSAEKRVKMSRKRRTIAKRLVEAQQTAAMLTTFNEVDMQAVIDMRERRKQWFIDKHGIKLGFMSFFTKASAIALKEFPAINAEIDGEEMILKYHYDIGIAVGAEDGLVVPVLRDADRMSFADIEKKIKEFGTAARAGTLQLGDLVGGTFTITNGGIFGSMLSTPILNAPQVAILGLHNIVERPTVVKGEIVIRPIMYTALSYDHRIVDGREAVQFLVRIKQLIEDPEQLLLA